MSHRILIVDDHPVVREGYQTLIDDAAGLDVVGTACCPETTLEHLSTCVPDLIVLDLKLGDEIGFDLIADVKENHPEVGVLVVSMFDEALFAHQALEYGADGYLMKTEADEVLLEGIRTVARSQVYLSPNVTERLLSRADYGGDGAISPEGRLTERELDVFTQMGYGKDTSQIARKLDLSPKTVGTHQRKIREKLGLDSTEKVRQRAVLWNRDQSTADP